MPNMFTENGLLKWTQQLYLLLTISVIQIIERQKVEADMDWPKALMISGFFLLLLNWGVIISFLVFKYLTRWRAQCKTPTPATRRRSRWKMSQSAVRDSLDTIYFFRTTEQDVSDGKDSLDSSSPVEMSSRRASPFVVRTNDKDSKWMKKWSEMQKLNLFIIFQSWVQALAFTGLSVYLQSRRVKIWKLQCITNAIQLSPS